MESVSIPWEAGHCLTGVPGGNTGRDYKHGKQY